MDREKLTIKSTDMIVLRTGPDEQITGVYRAAERLHAQTGAVLLVLPYGSSIEHLAEEEARRLWQTLNRRFGNA